MDKKNTILWVDDEIHQLKPHIMFLKNKGYEVITASNGEDAIEHVRRGDADVVLLDEMMPGLDGLSTLEEIRDIDAYIPVVMITKSEEERLMEDAIGKEITDYILKPVNPSQILLSLKKIFEGTRIQEKHVIRNYTKEYREVYAKDRSTDKAWYETATWLAYWDIIFDNHPDTGLGATHSEFHKELNIEFAHYIRANYEKWVNSRPADRPTLSVDIPNKKLLPHLKDGKKVFYIVIDCMRLDQWMAVEDLIAEHFDILSELYYSILPTATPYSRNAIFSGLFPSELAKTHPKIWQTAFADEASRNRFEHQLLDRLIRRQNIDIKGDTRYIKILDPDEGKDLLDKLPRYLNSPVSSVVVNFLDILAHSRAASDVLKEVANDEKGLRMIMRTWFKQSPLFQVLKRISEKDNIVIITTDHGSIIGKKGLKAYGRRDTSTNLRYKYGDNLNAEKKASILVKDPRKWKLPAFSVTTNYIIAEENYYFLYPSNFRQYEKQYKNSVLHGGISIEEMIVPVITLLPKGSR
ncbi:MAG: response regulator [Candidatus Zixiibacteriota bacterium]